MKRRGIRKSGGEGVLPTGVHDGFVKASTCLSQTRESSLTRRRRGYKC